MKKIKQRYFREDMYRMFAIHALIPIAIVTLITYGIIAIIWNHEVIKQTNDKEIWIRGKLKRVTNDLINEVDNLNEDENLYSSISDFRHKKNLYEQLYYFTNSVEERIDFYVLDEDFKVLVGSNKKKPIFVPTSNEVSWGITRRMKEHPKDVILECNKSGDFNRTKILVGKVIKEHEQIRGYLIFVLYGDEFTRIMGATSTQIIVTDSYDNLFLTTALGYTNSLGKIKDEFKDKVNYIKIGNETYYKRESSILGGKLKIYTFTPVGRLNKILIYAGIFIAVAILSLSIAMLGVLKRITKEKTKVIDKVVDAFKKAQTGNLDIILDINSYKEFEVIGSAYNSMIKSIKGLVAINKEKVKQTSIAEIKQLESQFNPHFLFNTLENIRYTAKLDSDAASKMIISLSSLLRYSINNNMSDVTIAEDIEYTKKYLLIQKYRFHERFNYTVYMEKGTETCVVPRLIIQPIIENSIKHGFGDKESLTVRIKVSFLADDLVIVIYDDGVGMPKEMLEQIQGLLKAEGEFVGHIGIYNVHRRIQLMYGKAYGIDLKSELGEGMVVRIILPIHKGEI